MTLRRLFFIVIIVIGFTSAGWATHNRAGEITYEQLGPLTIRATITTYTRTSSFAADRDSLEMNWGDGIIENILRSNGNGTELPNDIKVNYYIAEHTYPTRGAYVMSVTDPNRIAGILNIDFPNSVNIQFYIETRFTLLDTRFQGRNNSAILLQPPVDYACVGQIFTHNPNAYDPDGDSLGYELITPFQSQNLIVPNYELPDQIRPGPENIATLNPLTGDFVWNAPPIQGEFNLTYRINEYREGVLINSIIRDMQILVRACPDMNRAPLMEVPEEICVIAGEKISLDILANDLDTSEILTLTALGGPFEQTISPATFEVPMPLNNSMATGRFEWQTDCEHVSVESYKVVFKVTDLETRPNSGLATLKTLLIKVVAPPPQNLVAEYDDGRVKLTWDQPYLCDESTVFQGFSVWRRSGSKDITIDSCRGGLEGQGYEKIIFITDDIVDGKYTAFDLDIDGADIWCYRILGEYAKLTDSGNPFNKVQSITSNEACVLANRETALMTLATVRTTSTDGMVGTQWWLPLDEDIDPARYPGPYANTLKTAANLNGNGLQAIPGASWTAAQIRLLDTLFEVNNLNTVSTANSFGLDLFYQTNRLFSSSQSASTVFLSSRGNDERAILNWDFNVPWDNYSYIVYAVNADNSITPIDTTAEQTSTIFDLVNGQEYCYLVESFGRYNIVEINDPIVNRSQISCASPMDSLAPCAPTLAVNTICENANINAALVNTVSWQKDFSCDQRDDIASFNIYFKDFVNDPFTLIENINQDRSQFEHLRDDNIAGCYAITAIDSSGNESELSIEICVDNCPAFELPNAFTPNGDGANDTFKPRVARFIENVDFIVYNRWGQEVFTTAESLINWDGRDKNGKELVEGTYYYTCSIFERRVEGIIQNPTILTGNIQIIR